MPAAWCHSALRTPAFFCICFVYLLLCNWPPVIVTVHGFAISFILILNSEGSLKLTVSGSQSSFCRKGDWFFITFYLSHQSLLIFFSFSSSTSSASSTVLLFSPNCHSQNLTNLGSFSRVYAHLWDERCFHYKFQGFSLKFLGVRVLFNHCSWKIF